MDGDYPIIGFNNNAGGSFQVFDATNGWTNAPGFTGYDKWYQLSIGIVGGQRDYFVNGTLEYADTTVTGTTSLGNVMLEGYNGGNSYDISWGNLGATPASVSDAALTAGTVTATGGVEGETATSFSATFTDGNPSAPTSDFSGTISWGDSSTTAFTSGAVTANGGGSFTISGFTHQYAEEGTKSITVAIKDVGGSSTTDSGTTSVSDAALTAGTVTATGGVEGANTSSLTATFTDGNPSGSHERLLGHDQLGRQQHHRAFTSGAVTANGGGSFTISGLTHQYAEEGTKSITVAINDVGGSSTTDSGTTTVSDAPLRATAGPAFNAVEGNTSGPVVVATFTDANPGNHTGDFTTAINWGDSTPLDSSGVITYNAVTKVYTVTGVHTYAEEGSYSVASSASPTLAGSRSTLARDSTRPALVVTSATEEPGVWYPDRYAPAGFSQTAGGIDESIGQRCGRQPAAGLQLRLLRLSRPQVRPYRRDDLH